jgi:hypothetical protein
MLAAAPQVLSHPIGEFVNKFPWGFFFAVHVVLFIVGAYFASRSFSAGETWLGAGFTLFAVAELVYLTYHINITTFLFAHTIAEVLDALAFVSIFAAAVSHALVSTSASAGASANANASPAKAGAAR